MKRLLVILAVALTIFDSRAFVAAGAAPTAAELDAMLAPIALYPDQLLAQMLLSASNPGRLATLSEWLRSQGSLKGSELQNAAAASGFPDSYVALVIFPDVVDYMAGRMDWTTKLGQAFASDRSAVFASIQRLRAKAKAAGTLKTTPQQQVETKTTSSGDQVIVIEPTNPQIVYVPQYNPQVVYTQPTSTTVVVQQDNSAANAAVAGMIGFTAGIAIGAAFDNNYYGPYGWHGGGYMYNDVWDDYYDAREDAREDWQDHREDLNENRSDRAEDARENRSDRSQNAQQSRTDRQQNRTSSGTTAQNRTSSGTAAQNRTSSGTAATTTATQNRTTSQESRGYSRDSGTTGARDRSGTKSDAFSGYSSGKSTRSSSERGQRSRSSSRSGGSRRR
jgi:Protein of unknown function (DUF3300)